MTAPSDVRTCYRHPDRVSGISCQRCDRPICPQCMHQASVGFHCPECTKAGKQKVYQGAASWTSRPIATQVLMGVSIVAYVAMAITAGMEPFTTGGKLLGPQIGERGILPDGALFGPLVEQEPWRLVTSGFLHSPLPFGIVHIGFNMYLLWQLGRMLEPVLGRARFLALYAIGEAGSTVGAVVLEPLGAGVGASGAVFGLMAATVVLARERNIDLMKTGLPQLVGINLVITFASPGVSIGGHIGGLVGGFVGGALLIEGTKRLGPKRGPILTAVTVALALALFALSYVLMSSKYGVYY